jgi:hypothetical protein
MSRLQSVKRVVGPHTTLGSRYILQDFHLKLISRYVRYSLSGRLQVQLAWEGWMENQPDHA